MSRRKDRDIKIRPEDGTEFPPFTEERKEYLTRYCEANSKIKKAEYVLVVRELTVQVQEMIWKVSKLEDDNRIALENFRRINGQIKNINDMLWREVSSEAKTRIIEREAKLR